MSRTWLASVALLFVAADPPGVDLKGLVTDPDGKPLPGAHVFISTARVRRGTSPLCPSCYPDCIKTAQTDSTGKFVIPKLDPELIFRVLVVSETHKAQVVENVDPAVKALETFLVPLPPTLDPRKTIRGRVLGSKGEPIVGATVEPYGAKLKDRRWWGMVREVDPLTVTNLRGEFLITSIEPDIALDVRVDAREHAKRIVPLLSPANRTTSRWKPAAGFVAASSKTGARCPVWRWAWSRPIALRGISSATPRSARTRKGSLNFRMSRRMKTITSIRS